MTAWPSPNRVSREDPKHTSFVKAMVNTLREASANIFIESQSGCCLSAKDEGGEKPQLELRCTISIGLGRSWVTQACEQQELPEAP